MNPIGSNPIPTSAPTAPSGSVQERLQVSMLKKSLDVQQQQAAELMRMVQGKGSVIDLRA